MSTRRSRVQAVCWSTAEPCPTDFLPHRRPQTGTFRRWSSLLKYYTMELKRSHTHLEKCCGEEHREEYVMCYTLRFTPLRFNSLHFTLLCFTLLYFTLLYFISLYFTLLYFTLLYFTLLYFTLLYFTLLYLLRIHYCLWQRV